MGQPACVRLYRFDIGQISLSPLTSIDDNDHELMSTPSTVVLAEVKRCGVAMTTTQSALNVHQSTADAVQADQDFGPQVRSGVRREKGAVTWLSHRADTEDFSITIVHRNELCCKYEGFWSFAKLPGKTKCTTWSLSVPTCLRLEAAGFSTMPPLLPATLVRIRLSHTNAVNVNR